MSNEKIPQSPQGLRYVQKAYIVLVCKAWSLSLPVVDSWHPLSGDTQHTVPLSPDSLSMGKLYKVKP